MVKGVCILCFLLGSFFYAYTQTQYTINGIIQDSLGAPLPKATVRILTASDSLQTLSGGSGSFSVSGLRDPSVEIRVTMSGYQPYYKKILVSDMTKKTITLAPIVLQVQYEELQTVIVRQVHAVTVKRDTLQYHAGAYAMRAGSMLGDLMKKLPGIMVNTDSVMVMGKRISRVMVDGKRFFGGDVQAAIRNLPYDIIDNVEIIDDYGDKARLTGVRTGEPEKVLNVTLKKDKQNGLVGNVQGGAGNEDQYIANLNAELFKGERKLSLAGALNNNNTYGNEYIKFLKLSYADQWGPKWSGTGDGSLSGDDHLFQNTIIQDNYYTGGKIHQEQDNTTGIHKQDAAFNYELNFVPDANSHLRINSSFDRQRMQENDQIGLFSTESDSAFNKTTQSTTVNQVRTETTNSDSKLHFEQVFPHSGQRFSLDANLRYILTQQADDNLTQSQIRSDSVNSNSLQHLLTNNNNTAWDMGGIVHYYIPAGKGGFVETSYGLHHTLTENDRTTQAPDSVEKNWQVVDSLSNDYSLRTTIQDWQAGYTRHGDKVDMSLGMVAEPEDLTGSSPGKGMNYDFHYLRIYPAGSFSYAFNQSRKIGFEYITNLTAPTLQQLQPVTDLTNPQYPVTGNPGLKPTFIQTGTLHFDQNSLEQTKYYGFGIGIGYSATQDMVISNIVHPHDSSTVIQHTYFENVNGAYSINLSWRFELPPVLHGRMKVSGWGTFGSNHGLSMADYEAYATNMLAWSQHLTLIYTIPDRLESNGTIGYDHSMTTYGSAINPSVYSSSLSWRLENHYYFLRNWILTAILVQDLNSGASRSLTPDPLFLYATLQRTFFRERQLTCSLIFSNILNSNAGVTQVTAPGIVTQTRANLIGRTIMFTAQWNVERFKKVKSVIR